MVLFLQNFITGKTVVKGTAVYGTHSTIHGINYEQNFITGL